ncbi:MAG TPA: hypothetical protein VK489_06420 [Ferruginibacter sp.]|nr:hypothetical protein [Ferruginibacter sp.]
MAYSKCPKCDNTYFEVTENAPTKSNYKLLFVQCSKCGSVVGTMDFYNIGTLIGELEKKVDNISLSSSTSSINNNLNIVNQNIANLFNYVKSGFDRIEGANKNKKDTD